MDIVHTNKKMDKTCAICGKILLKLKNESNARFDKKKTCGTAHARELLKKEGRGWYNRENRDNLFSKLENLIIDEPFQD